jgi:hypothetical protein
VGHGHRTITEILAAITTTERVSAFLAAYAERDAAIERLIDDITVGRLRLVGDLRSRLQPHMREAFRATSRVA